MNLIEQSWHRLFPDHPISYSTKIKYSGQFKDYNANIRLYRNQLELRLCRKWKQVNEEILIGLIQSLLLKLFKKKSPSINIDLYNSFVKNLHLATPKDNIDPTLEQSFNRVNEKYFYSSIEIPNLVWGHPSVRKLGCYEYKTDVISISSIFKQTEQTLLDYIMYHELLHKKHKFSSQNGRNYFHSTKFKQDEKAFENSELMERKIKSLARQRRKSFLSNIFSW